MEEIFKMHNFDSNLRDVIEDIWDGSEKWTTDCNSF